MPCLGFYKLFTSVKKASILFFLVRGSVSLSLFGNYLNEVVLISFSCFYFDFISAHCHLIV